MCERYWSPDQGLGGMAKAAWLLVQEHGIVAAEQIAEECGFGSTAESEEALERLEAVGLVSSIEKTALVERFLLMDWLRAQSESETNASTRTASFSTP